MATQSTDVLRVVARRDGFRRAGFVFGTVARDIPLVSLTDAARAAIEADPMLVATEVVAGGMTAAVVETAGNGDGDGEDAGASATATTTATANTNAGTKTKAASRKRK